MAMSRTYLGAHWASDVIAGSCIGTGLAVVWSAALELERARRRRGRTGDRCPLDAGDAHGPVLRTISVVLLSLGLACVVALHVLRPDLGPAGHRISEYAIGPYGYRDDRRLRQHRCSACWRSARRCRVATAAGHEPSPRRSPPPGWA